MNDLLGYAKGLEFGNDISFFFLLYLAFMWFVFAETLINLLWFNLIMLQT